MPDQQTSEEARAEAFKSLHAQLDRAFARIAQLIVDKHDQREQLRQLNGAILRKNKLIASLRATNADLVKQLTDPAVPLTPSVGNHVGGVPGRPRNIERAFRERNGIPPYSDGGPVGQKGRRP